MKKILLSNRLIRFLLIVILTAGVTIAVGLGLESHVTSLTAVFVLQQPAPQSQSSGKRAIPTPSPVTTALSSLAASPTAPPPVASATPSQPAKLSLPESSTATLSPTQDSSGKTSYGHFSYQENDQSRLQVVGQYMRNGDARDEVLDVEAVQAFHQMQDAASMMNVSLMPLSGFRDMAVQTVLFENQTMRQGSKAAAARWSAPPGYSEHHTGYAIDIADEQAPDADLQMSFAGTDAYQWLLANASQFGFELSFLPNNIQGISYEPWHWRFVGSGRAINVFAYAKSFEWSR
jgi:zinc D-Ala-D-Ala carboxypeptidase